MDACVFWEIVITGLLIILLRFNGERGHLTRGNVVTMVGQLVVFRDEFICLQFMSIKWLFCVNEAENHEDGCVRSSRVENT